MMENECPDDFRCPISLEIMRDPVILSSGHTFERSSIQRWLDAGHHTCPVSLLPLPSHPSLIPNLALRSLIGNFASKASPPSSPSSYRHRHDREHEYDDPGDPPHHWSRPPLPHHTHHRSNSDSNFNSVVSNNSNSSINSNCNSKAESLPALISSLSSSSSTSTPSVEALQRLHSLLSSAPWLRRAASDLGAASVILNSGSLFGAGSPAQVREAALAVLFDLSLDDLNKVGLVAEGAVPLLVSCLRSPGASSAAQALAATTLTSLALVQVNKATIGAHPSAVPALVHLLRHRKLRPRREAATALYTLCSFPDNQRRAVDAGAVPVLLALAATGVERAVEVLALLARCDRGRDEMRRIDGCLEVLLRVLKDGRPRGVQHALAVLNSLCGCCDGMARDAVRSGVLEICLGLVGNENLKIQRNASSLIDTLRT